MLLVRPLAQYRPGRTALLSRPPRLQPGPSERQPPRRGTDTKIPRSAHVVEPDNAWQEGIRGQWQPVGPIEGLNAHLRERSHIAKVVEKLEKPPGRAILIKLLSHQTVLVEAQRVDD